MIQRNVILVGITGVGKTTIGRALAKATGANFIDLDKSIELSCGVDLPTIFAIEGEDGFRKREADELNKVIKKSNYVLSTGGGCIIYEKNRQLITSSDSLVIQLIAEVDVLVNRLSNSVNKRPLLENLDLRNKILDLYESRKDFYAEVSDYTISTSGYKPYQVISQIKKYLEK